MSLDFYLIYNNDGNDIEVFWRNITHNLTTMAKECGLYEALWRPDQNGFVYAKDIISILEKGYEELGMRKKHYEQFNSSNGWGMYDNFKSFVKYVLEACTQYPNSIIKVSR